MKPSLFSLGRCSHARALYSTHGQNLAADRSIYVSSSTNPYFNLSLEDWLFRNKDPREPLLLLYKDDPCIVIGRNQNPWKEVNLQLAASRNVPVIRRRSGGGTVYHDLGNMNYSLHLPRAAFNRSRTAQIVVRAVRALGIDAEVNERNDICAAGSAYKIVNKRAYHHGTMLISTRLDLLGRLLHNTKDTMITKGVASVRSAVQNLQHFDHNVTENDFIQSMIRVFRDEYNIIEEADDTVDEYDNAPENHAISKGMEELKSWDWLYGQTPEFTYSLARTFGWGTVKAEITAKQGVIISSKVECSEVPQKDLEQLDQALQDSRYGFLGEPPISSADQLGSEVRTLRIQELWNWLRDETSS